MTREATLPIRRCNIFCVKDIQFRALWKYVVAEYANIFSPVAKLSALPNVRLHGLLLYEKYGILGLAQEPWKDKQFKRVRSMDVHFGSIHIPLVAC